MNVFKYHILKISSDCFFSEIEKFVLIQDQVTNVHVRLLLVLLVLVCLQKYIFEVFGALRFS